jgi:hypothetical protein
MEAGDVDTYMRGKDPESMERLRVGLELDRCIGMAQARLGMATDRV